MRRSGMSSLCCDWPCKYPQVHVRLGGGACVRVYVCVRAQERKRFGRRLLQGNRTGVSTQHTLIFNQTIPGNSTPYRERDEGKEAG